MFLQDENLIMQKGDPKEIGKGFREFWKKYWPIISLILLMALLAMAPVMA